jgi:hypothetical protein
MLRPKNGNKTVESNVNIGTEKDLWGPTRHQLVCCQPLYVSDVLFT